MRILHVINTLDPAHGGPPAVAVRLAAAQAALGHTVTILTYAEPGAEDRTARAISAVPHADRLSIRSLPPLTPAERLLVSTGRREAAALIDAADVLHIHGIWFRLFVAAASLARRRGVPYVIRPAGMLDPWALRQRRLKKQVAMALGWRRMLDGAAFIHMLNEDERRLAEPLRLRAPLEVIPNGVFLEELHPLPSAGTFRAAHPEIGSHPFILFLSRLHYKKGLDYLADAFARIAPRFPRHHLVVAGPDDGARPDFEARIAAAGLTDRVHLPGGLYGPDKLAALIDADCFCLPSRQEGFSVAITEALACGLPAVVSDDCHFPEVARAGAGVVVRLDADAVAAGLEQVLSDPARRAQMSRAATHLIESGYTWPLIAQRALVAYARHAPRRAHITAASAPAPPQTAPPPPSRPPSAAG